VRLAQLGQAGRTGLLAHLDQVLGVESQPATDRKHVRQRLEVHRMLALVVGDPPAVPTAGRLDQAPGREPRLPFRFQATDHVAVAVAEHCRPALVLDALGEQEGGLGPRVGEGPALEAHRLEGRLDLLLEVADQRRGLLRILALRRNRDAARQGLAKCTRVELATGKVDGFHARHCSVQYPDEARHGFRVGKSAGEYSALPAVAVASPPPRVALPEWRAEARSTGMLGGVLRQGSTIGTSINT
jgi:hypothetical protein